MEWVRGEEIGYGSFSTVNLAISKNPTSRFPKTMAVKSSSHSQSDLLIREKSILEELRDCPRIIQCFGSDYSIENSEKLFNLFLEYAIGGTLADKIKKESNHRLPESEVRRYTKSILEGIKYIHDNKYVHCDIKPQNILLFPSHKNPEHDTIKIADFGLVKREGEKKEKAGVELRGTPLYMSPEVVAEGEQNAPADVWAIGCIVAEMAAGTPAWRCRPETGTLRLLMRIGVGDELPEIPEELSSEGRNFLEKIFVKDPKRRWTAEMLLEHPFMTVGCWGKVCDVSSPRGPLDPIDGYELVQWSCEITEIPTSGFDTSCLSQVDSVEPYDKIMKIPSSDFETWYSGQGDSVQSSDKITKIPSSDFNMWNSGQTDSLQSPDKIMKIPASDFETWYSGQGDSVPTSDKITKKPSLDFETWYSGQGDLVPFSDKITKRPFLDFETWYSGQGHSVPSSDKITKKPSLDFETWYLGQDDSGQMGLVQRSNKIMEKPSSDFETWCSRKTDLDQSSIRITKVPSLDFDTWFSGKADICFDSRATQLQQLMTCQGPDWSETDGWIDMR